MTADSVSIEPILEELANTLRNSKKLERVARYWNGFENWLKFEWVDALATKRDWHPWIEDDGNWTYGQVGVEYRYRRAREDPPSERMSKLIDLWLAAVGTEDTRNEPTYYIEIKTAFANTNQSKQIDAWKSDFEALEQVFSAGSGGLREDVQGFASVLVTVGIPNRPNAVPDDCWSAAIVDGDPMTGYHLPIRMWALRRER